MSTMQRLFRHLRRPPSAPGPSARFPSVRHATTYHGPNRNWREVETREFPDLQIKAKLLQHEPSGAGFLHLEADDENNAFSVHFRVR